MRFLEPKRTCDLEQLSPTTWTTCGANPAFTFEISPGRRGFIGFFLTQRRGRLAPKIFFDTGEGFDELSSLALKAFPFGFYHIALDENGPLQRIAFRPCLEPTTFRFNAVETKNSLVIAALHYLFNLRYQNISALDRKTSQGFVVRLVASIRRIAKFFEDVKRGKGLAVQESADDKIVKLLAYLAKTVEPVALKMAETHADLKQPLISFVTPIYNTKAVYLDDLIQSFLDERAAYAELILSDDGSTSAETLARLARASREGITVLLNTENRGIAAASNGGIAKARGVWISFIDHDDRFAPGGIAMIAAAIEAHPNADFFYTDEIVVDARLQPTGTLFKPVFDSVLLSGVNYINHFSVFRLDRVRDLGCLRTDRDGAQDYDLLLRYLTAAARAEVVHIPFPAYLWRREDATYSSVNAEKAVANARSAIAAAYAAQGRSVEVRPARNVHLHRVAFRDRGANPLVSVVILNKNSFALIAKIVADLRQRTDYAPFEIVIVDNGSDAPEVLDFYASLSREVPGITIDIREEAFNFAAMCNRGARLARGDALLFLNNDIEVGEADWLAEMVECLAFDSVGIVGAKLVYPNGLVQHNGVIVGLGEAAGHWYIGQAGDAPGPMGRFFVRQTLSAVTGACMLVTRACFDLLDGFDAVAFPIAYNDVDFCLRARAAGLRTVWTPFAELVHHESVSRGSDETGDNNMRFKVEFARLQERHATVDYVDDAYHPLYDRCYAVPHLLIKPEVLPPARPNFFS